MNRVPDFFSDCKKAILIKKRANEAQIYFEAGATGGTH
jgi:hypothetical protein